MRGRGLDFSFSGLKTAVSTHLKRSGVPQGQALADLCASFQAAVVEQLVAKTELALAGEKFAELLVAGGVPCNHGLRAALQNQSAGWDGTLHVPPPQRCTDHAAMIA